MTQIVLLHDIRVTSLIATVMAMRYQCRIHVLYPEPNQADSGTEEPCVWTPSILLFFLLPHTLLFPPSLSPCAGGFMYFQLQTPIKQSDEDTPPTQIPYRVLTYMQLQLHSNLPHTSVLPDSHLRSRLALNTTAQQAKRINTNNGPHYRLHTSSTSPIVQQCVVHHIPLRSGLVVVGR